MAALYLYLDGDLGIPRKGPSVLPLLEAARADDDAAVRADVEAALALALADDDDDDDD